MGEVRKGEESAEHEAVENGRRQGKKSAEVLLESMITRRGVSKDVKEKEKKNVAVERRRW